MKKNKKENVVLMTCYPCLEGLVGYYLNEKDLSKQDYIKKEFIRMAKLNDCLVRALLEKSGEKWSEIFKAEVAASFGVEASQLEAKWLKILLPSENDLINFLRR